MPLDQSCPRFCCFFCIMNEDDEAVRRSSMKECLKGIPFLEDEDLILVVSALWNVAMARPDDRELPSLGIFGCMAGLINRALNDSTWLLNHQNIYIPYYAAHIIGSYTMNKAESAEKAVESGVVLPLLDLLRGKMSWVEQRVAVRALGHLASYETTFEAVRMHEEEIVRLAMSLASSCVEAVYRSYVGVKDRRRRREYQFNLLTRGVGGAEMDDRKAEEWASQLQCWSIHLLNCFAVKERSLRLMCKKGFLNDLCGMWGGLSVNQSSPGGVGLIRILCYSKVGRKNISESRKVLRHLCNLSRSSDDWQYIGVDCLLLLLRDPNTRFNVLNVAASYLVDLVELRSLGTRSDVGEAIAKALIHDDLKSHHHENLKTKNLDHVQKALKEIRVLKRQQNENLAGKRAMVNLVRQEGNQKLSLGEVEEAMSKYTEALKMCPVKHRKARIALYSSRAQCNLLVKSPDAAISDATRALCLSSPPNCHGRSLWIRSQAYDAKGMAKESLLDCMAFINLCMGTRTDGRFKIPYYVVRMIGKQMDSTSLFGAARLREMEKPCFDRGRREDSSWEDGKFDLAGEENPEIMSVQLHQSKSYRGLSTIFEEPYEAKQSGCGRKKLGRVKMRRNKTL